MDVDFHYHATYVAARFAGYSHNRAVTIATSAQMIDENNAHTIFKSMSSSAVTTEASANRLKDMDVVDIYENDTDEAKLLMHYECIESFQTVGTVGTTKSTRYVQAVWAAFHFLPGNFDVKSVVDTTLISPLWKKRICPYQKVNKHHDFQWMCRPHSPMAISLVRNCTNKVSEKEITDFGLEDYLTGVTAHVFADTFAHQDFTHAQNRHVNGFISFGKESFQWRSVKNSNKLPLEGNKSIYEAESNLEYTKWVDAKWAFGESSPSLKLDVFNFFYVGHGQVGHTPDNSSLVMQYHPTWSSDPIIRNNPIVYLDAFVHLVWALFCIRTGEIYEPFEVNTKNLSDKYTKINSKFNEENLTKVWKVLCIPRDPFGTESKASPELKSTIKDSWDLSIFQHGREWFELINTLGFGAQEKGDKPLMPWLPGKSHWILDVRSEFSNNMELSNKEVYKKRNERSNRPWLNAAQFESLEYFKFNVAVKHHYRFVKDQMHYFRQPLSEHWAGDSHCYVNDFSVFNKCLRGNIESPMLVQFLIDLRALFFKFQEVSQKETRVANDTLKRGLGRLIDDVCALNTDAEANIFIRQLSQALHDPVSNAEFIEKYGLFDENGKPIDRKRVTKLKIMGLDKHWTHSEPLEIASNVLDNFLKDDYISKFDLAELPFHTSDIDEPTNTSVPQGGRKQPGGIRRGG
ncbi:MAG: hypothetical protein RLZZ66_1302 [Pseudomonadota bacterium]|jgi:hypothetical protein